jgi:hypothetical protein
MPVILIGCGGGEQHPQPTTRAEFESQIEKFVQDQNAEAIDALRYQVEGADTPEPSTGARLVDFREVELSWRDYPDKDLRTWEKQGRIPVPQPTAYLIVKDVADHDAGTARYDIPVGRRDGKLYFPASKPDERASKALESHHGAQVVAPINAGVTPTLG